MKNRFKAIILLFAALGFSATQAATINYQKRTINIIMVLTTLITKRLGIAKRLISQIKALAISPIN